MRSSRTEPATSLAIAMLTICALAGCKAPDPPPPAPAAPSAAPSATVTSLAAFTVPAGNTGAVWVPEFAVRSETDGGLAYVAAAARCASVSLSLCSEAQWSRACTTDARLSSIETWTASADAERGFVVRGGGSCDARKVAPGSEVSPSRGAICCSRAIGIASSNTNVAFLRTTSGKLLAFESAMRKGDGRALRPLLADPISFYGAAKTSDSAASTFEAMVAKHPGLWVIHDTCDVTIQKEPGTWTADCRKVAQQDGQVASVVTRYVWSAEGLITSISDPKTMRAFAAP